MAREWQSNRWDEPHSFDKGTYPTYCEPMAHAWWWIGADPWHIAEINGRYWIARDEDGEWRIDFGLECGPYDTLDEARAVYLLVAS